MAISHEVKCINKSDRNSTHERITHISGIKNDRSRWKITQEAAIAGIECGDWEFYVSADGKSVKVIISISAKGNKYLKTENDGEQPNNLLSLPECP